MSYSQMVIEAERKIREGETRGDPDKLISGMRWESADLDLIPDTVEMYDASPKTSPLYYNPYTDLYDYTEKAFPFG